MITTYDKIEVADAVSPDTIIYDSEKKPKKPKLFIENIPDELKKQNQWVLWQYGWNGKKWTKPPVSREGAYIDIQDPTNRKSFEDVVKDSGNDAFDGIGFVLTQDDGYIGIDVDHCLDGGEPTALMNEITGAVDSYTEISPSGNGIRIFIKGVLDTDSGNKNSQIGLEVYESGRYLTITGDMLGSRTDILENQESIDNICDKYLQRKLVPLAVVKDSSTNLSDEEILRKLRNAKNSQEFSSLWSGETSKNPSDADYELCLRIGFYTQIPDQIERIFNQSSLGQRSKWIDRKDYRDRTIGSALKNLSDIYNPTFQVVDNEAIKNKVAEVLGNDNRPPEFSTSDLPEAVKNYIELLCSSSKVSPIIALMSFTSSVSSLIRQRVFLPQFDPRTHNKQYFQELHPNLWQLVISNSGTFKTTMLNEGSKIFRGMDIETNNQIKALEDSNGGEVVDDDTEKNKLKRNLLILPNSMTGEAFVRRMMITEGGVFLLSELKTWLSQFEKQYSVGFKSLLTEAYDVTSPIFVETMKRGEERVERPYIAIGGVSTMEWVRRSITQNDIDSGFFARFLIFCPTEQYGIPPGLPLNNSTFDHSSIYEIERKLTILCSEDLHKEYHFSDRGKDRFLEIHKSMFQTLSKMNDSDKRIIDPFVKRWGPYVLKFAMIFQLFIDESSDALSLESIESGYSVVRYAMESTIWLLKEELTGNHIQMKSNKILKYIAKQGGKILWKKLLPSRCVDGGTEEYSRCIQYLVEIGKVSVKKGKKKSEELIFLI